MAAIEVSGLSKQYGDVRANDDLTFTVQEGEIFGYLGPNGAGKTTTIRSLRGFQSPTEGTATVLGHDVRDEAELLEAKADVGYLPGDPGLDEQVTGREYLDYQASLKGDERRSYRLGRILVVGTPNRTVPASASNAVQNHVRRRSDFTNNVFTNHGRMRGISAPPVVNTQSNPSRSPIG